ncbi:MAG: cell division protein FtsL [Deltaproteobacteria bacterium]|nr:cell division protein FtsL [Deltaproteobacteria bacterium]
MNVSARLGNRRLVMTRPGPLRLSFREALLALALVVLVALFYAYCEIRARDLAYEVSRALETQRELREVNRRFKVELTNLRSPQRLEYEARRLGLIRAPEDHIRGLK